MAEIKKPEKLKSQFNEYPIETDKFSEKEQEKIVDMIIKDIEADRIVQAEWLEQRKKDLQHYNGERPSILEGLTKKAWQSDRNLGMTAAVCDSYHATLLATTWNPESIHYIATERNDIDNKDNKERFTKWTMGKNEINFFPQAEDYIFNKDTQGFAIFKIYWKVWFEWIDRFIPRKDGTYEEKTEHKRWEKSIIENKADLDDILMPRYGAYIQNLPHIIDTIHLTGNEILQEAEKNVFVNIKGRFIEALKQIAFTEKKKGLEAEKAEMLSLADVTDDDMRNLPIDLYEWYGWYEKNNRYERYRFRIEEKTKTFLSGKPLRKITPDSKYPFVGGPFIKLPGQLRGKSLPWLTRDPVNALNSIYNQKSDFQTQTNMLIGFHRVGEGYTKAKFELEPGVSFPVDGNPNESIFFPNLQRSMAWAESDIRILFEIIEKLTGAASYFLTSERGISGTATRDMIVERHSQNRFGKWVNSIQDEFCEAITMAIDLYAKFAPKNLAERILGEDGKQLFPNFSRETIRYKADARMEPDILAGSKSYERQLALWGFTNLQQTIWFDPRINPKGNWLLVYDTMKRMGIAAPDRYLPPEPKAEFGTGRTIADIWAKLMQGEKLEVDMTWNIPEVLAGLYKKKAENYFDLDIEYRPNLDDLIFKTEIAMRDFIKKIMEQQIADRIAQSVIAQRGQMPMPEGATPRGTPEATPAMAGMPQMTFEGI